MLFLSQLKSICSGNNDLETNLILKERISKGVDYFYNNTVKYISEVLGEDYPSIDNKELNKQFTNHFTQLLNEINLKLAVLESMKEGFDIKTYLAAKSKAKIEMAEEKKKTPKAKVVKQEVSSDIQNKELYERLRIWRNNKADELNIPSYCIFQQKALIALANKMPTTGKEMITLPGIGKKVVETYGVDILGIIDEYRADKNLWND